MQTVVDVSRYLPRDCQQALSELSGIDSDVVALIAADPECGDVILGTGGFTERSESHANVALAAGCVYLAQREICGALIAVFPKNEKAKSASLPSEAATH